MPVCDNPDLARDCLLAGGDDYELVFTVPAGDHKNVGALATSLDLALTCIGKINAGNEHVVTLLDAEQKVWSAPRQGFDHFA